MIRLLASLALLTAVTVEGAQATTVFNPPDGYWLAPEVYNGTLYGPSTPSGTSSNWNIAQWDGWAGNLPAFPASGTMQTSNNDMTVVLSGPWIDITATGWVNSTHHLNCNGPNNGEQDSFFGPTNSDYSGYPQAAVSLPYLNAIGDLTHSISFVALSYSVPNGSCPVTQAFAQTSFLLNNATSHQNFFFQIELFKENMAGGPQWWATGSGCTPTCTYGYTIPINDIVGGSIPSTIGQFYSFTFNMLPAIEGAIAFAAANYHMDGNVAHWQVVGAYAGQAIWGHVNLRVEYENWSLTY